MTHPILRLKPGKDKALRHRHPWVFSGAVASTQACPNGSIVAVHSHEGQHLGLGFLSANSPLRCRVFDFEPSPPAITEDYWAQRIRNAHAFRQRIGIMAHTTGYRLLNAEGDGLPGVIADAYANTVVLQLRTPGTHQLANLWASLLTHELGFTDVLQQTFAETDADARPDESADNASPEAESLLQDSPADDPDDAALQPIAFQEYGLQFWANPAKGQKTGYYLDQRENRRRVAHYAHNRRVLDVFCYGGGFSMHALAAGAHSALGIDGSAEALQLAQRHARANTLADRFSVHQADAFRYLKELPPGGFDLIVLDPPAFSKHHRTVPQAARGYKQINLLALRALPPGGLLATFSCSQHVPPDLFRKIVFAAAADARRHVRILEQLHQPPCHPVSIFHPEGEYLKGLLLYVE